MPQTVGDWRRLQHGAGGFRAVRCTGQVARNAGCASDLSNDAGIFRLTCARAKLLAVPKRLWSLM